VHCSGARSDVVFHCTPQALLVVIEPVTFVRGEVFCCCFVLILFPSFSSKEASLTDLGEFMVAIGHLLNRTSSISSSFLEWTNLVNEILADVVNADRNKPIWLSLRARVSSSSPTYRSTNSHTQDL
jgi:hypothetical protein